jgi:hypothetical protein
MVISGILYLVTRNERYLRFAWQVAYFLITSLLVFGVLYLLERFAMVGWRILL